jgi:predicted DNA-binding protein
MPDWPPSQGRRALTFELAAEHVDHLDAQASYLGCSRAAYLRQLIRRDIERIQATPQTA